MLQQVVLPNKIITMKNFILVLCIFKANQLAAQPLMNKLYDFQIGHTYSYKKVPSNWHIDTSLLQTNGSNLTWNFDTITLLPNIYSDSILSPTGTPAATTFSNADFVWKEYSGTLQYYRKSLDTVFYMGHYTFWPTTFTPNPITCVNNTTQSTNFLYSNFQTNVSRNGTWNYSARYNASGTLKLPGVTHNNVGLYVTVGGAATKYADYFWFKENQNDPVLRIQFVWTATSSIVQYLYVNTTALSPSNIDDLTNNGFSITPNPAFNHVYIQAPFNIQYYEVRNVFGQIEMKRVVDTSKYDIDISHLKQGIYFVTLTDNLNRRYTQKFIKE